MADSESMTGGGELVEAEVAKLASDAFRLAAWQGRPRDGEEGEIAPEFFQSVVLAFEALLSDRAQRAGFNFLRDGYGQGVAGALSEVPASWRADRLVGGGMGEWTSASSTT